jgi:hypothetical protein
MRRPWRLWRGRLLTVYNLPDDFVRHDEACLVCIDKTRFGVCCAVAGRVSRLLVARWWSWRGCKPRLLKKESGDSKFCSMDWPVHIFLGRYLIWVKVHRPISTFDSQSCLSSEWLPRFFGWLPCSSSWDLQLSTLFMHLHSASVVSKVNVPLCVETSLSPASAGF